MKFKQSNGRTKMTKELNIYQRINLVMADIAYVQKESKKVNNQYTFVSHDAVTATVRQGLVKHGIVPVPTVISCVQDGNRTVLELQVDFVNMDNPKDFISTRSFGYGIDQQDKGVGKARSYAIKYAYLQQFALETGDDPERDLIDHKPSVEWQGPLKVTELKAELRNLSSALDACGTPDKLDEIILEFEPVMAQAKVDLEAWYERAKKRLDEIIEISDLTRAGKADMHDPVEEV